MLLLKTYLDDLEGRIDCEQEESLLSSWKNFLERGHNEPIFTPKRNKIIPSKISFEAVKINDALSDVDTMILQQLYNVSELLKRGSGQPLLVRANYGTGILPSLFGAKIFEMPEETNTLPTCIAFENPREVFTDLLKHKSFPLENGWLPKVFEFSKKWLEITQDYPKIRKYVFMAHPDLQGPFDVLEILYGSELFLEVMDDPDFIHECLKMITEGYCKVMDEWVKIFGLHPYSAHWTYLQRGNIVLRIDSAMNFSPAQFEEFFLPYDSFLLKRYEGGTIHFCGKGDHYIPHLSKHEWMYSIHMTQPEYNDMEIIFKNTLDKNIRIIGFKQHDLAVEFSKRRDLKGLLETTL